MKYKKMKKMFLILLILMTASAAVYAEDTSPEEIDAFEAFDSALGGYYGEIGGQGLSYQHWFGNLGVQTALGLWYVEPDPMFKQTAYLPDSVEDTSFSYNIGVEVMYRVYSDSFQDWFDGCLYVFGGMMHMGNMVSTYNYVQTPVMDGEIKTYPYEGVTGPVYVPLFNPGFGIGFELVFFNHFSIPFEIGLMGSWAAGSIMPVDAGIRVQGGLRYRF